MKGNDRIIFGIGLAALALLLIGIFPNIGLTYDSHLYLKLSENLLDEGFSQHSFGTKPPLYPIILWLLQMDLILISLFNIGCWVGSMWFFYKLFCSRIESIFYKISLAIILFFSTSIMMVHNFVWIESPFLVLMIGFLYLRVNPLENLDFNMVLSATLLVGMVALKHLGIGLVIGFGLISLWKERSFKKAAFTYSPAILFFLLWQIKSFFLRGDLSRLDHTEGLDLLQNFNWIGQTLIHWFEPFSVNTFISIGLCVSLFLILLWEIRKADTINGYFQIIPIVLILIIATKADLLQADMERYFALFYPFFIFLIINKLSKQSWSGKIWVHIPVLIFIAYSVFRTAKNAWFWHGV